MLGASGLNHPLDKLLGRGPSCKASDKLIVAKDQPRAIDADDFVSCVGVKQRRHQSCTVLSIGDASGIAYQWGGTTSILFLIAPGAGKCE
jgi:hypothetical protein